MVGQVVVKNNAAKGWGIFLDAIEAFFSKGRLVFILIFLILFNIVCGVRRGNTLVAIGYILCVLSMALHLTVWQRFISPLYRLIKYIRVDKINSDSALNKVYKTGVYASESWCRSWEFPRRALVYLVMGLGIVPMLFSSVITTSFYGGKYAIVGDKVLPLDGRFTITAPIAPVKRFKTDKIRQVTRLLATSQDLIPISLEVVSNIMIRPDRDAVKDYADHEQLYLEQFDIRLQGAFRKIVGEIDLGALPSEIWLTSVLYRESHKFLEGFPLVWDGKFALANFGIIRR